MRILLLLLALAAACQGSRQPPLEEGAGINIRTGERRYVEIDPTRTVSTESPCSAGQILKREGDAWACADLADEIAQDRGLRDRLSAVSDRASFFTTARACTVQSDPGNNLEIRADCPQHRGATADPLVLRCPIVTPLRPTWSELELWVDDPELAAPDDSTVDVTLLAIDGSGVFDGRGLERLAPQNMRARGDRAEPHRLQFTPVADVRALELEVVLKTAPTVPATFRRARFCAFGLTGAAP